MAALCPPKPRLSEIAWVGLGVEVGLGVGAAHHVVERLVDLGHLVGARRQLG